jgi:putative transcriptional regulator
MLRVRLKADGRIVEILPDGSEQPLPRRLAALAEQMRRGRPPATVRADDAPSDAAYARAIRARSGLTQAEFAARIGVPLETVRNWEQEVAFAVLSTHVETAADEEQQARSA